MFRRSQTGRNFVQAYTIKQKKECDQTTELRTSLTATMSKYFTKQVTKEDTITNLTSLRQRISQLTT
jgi:hypothetical protein